MSFLPSLPALPSQRMVKDEDVRQDPSMGKVRAQGLEDIGHTDLTFDFDTVERGCQSL